MSKRKTAVALGTSEASSSQEPEKSRVIYIGHLPHGFYEHQLQGFFSQFGVVTNRKVSRNKKTGKAKHYAFVEFQLPEVAAIAAEAMNGYMLFTQKLVCHVLRAAEVREDLFKGTNRRFRKVNWQQIEEKRHNQERTPEQQAQRSARAVKRDAQRQKAIAAAGLEYSYTPLASMLEKKAARAVRDSEPGESPKRKKPKSKRKLRTTVA